MAWPPWGGLEFYDAWFIVDTGTPAGAAVDVPGDWNPYGGLEFYDAWFVLDSGTPAGASADVPGDWNPYGGLEFYDSWFVLDSGVPAGGGPETQWPVAVSLEFYDAWFVVGFNDYSSDPLPTSEVEFYDAWFVLDSGTPAGGGPSTDWSPFGGLEFYDAWFIADAPLPLQWWVNRKRDSDYWSLLSTFKRDFEFLLKNVEYIDNAVNVSHSLTTGKHDVDDLTNWVLGLTLVSDSPTALTNSVDDYVDVTVKANVDLAQSGWLLPHIGDGTEEGSFVYGNVYAIGSGANTGKSESAYYVQHSTGANRRNNIKARIIRRSVAAGDTDVQPYNIHCNDPTYNHGSFRGTPARASRDRNTIKHVDDLINAQLYPYTRNHYDRTFRNLEAIKNAIEFRHTLWVDDTLVLDELRGGEFMNPASIELNQDDTYQITPAIKAHGGNAYHVWPAAYIYDVLNNADTMVIPCADSTNLYLCFWRGPGISWTGSDLTTYYAPVITQLNDEPADATVASIDYTLSESVGDAIDTDLVGQLVTQYQIFQELWRTEHREPGDHNIGLGRLTGYSMVINGASITVGTAIDSITEHVVEAVPVTKAAYLVCIVPQDSTVGKIGWTVGGDETNVIVFARVVEAGTGTDAKLYVAKADRV